MKIVEPYGKELILDLHYCNSDTFTRRGIRNYFKRLCEIIDMERCDLHWWDYKGLPKEYAKAPAHLKGTSAVQFIKTSNITIHTLDTLRVVYLNIFSCKNFDEKVVAQFSRGWFESEAIAQMRVIVRL